MLGSTAEPQGPSFPVEIFELIIEFVIRSIVGDQPYPSQPQSCGKSDIRSLCLVSRSFSSICRPYIFQDVKICINGSLNHGHKLAEIINKDPPIANYIRCISYSQSFTYTRSLASREEDRSLHIFLYLPAVKCLKVDGGGGSICEEPDFDLTKLGFQTLLHHYISSEVLSSLHIRSINNLPILDIMECPNLETLVLGHCGFRGWDMPIPPRIASKGSKLKSFRAFGGKDIPINVLAFCPDLESINLTKLPRMHPPPPTQFGAVTQSVTPFNHVKSVESRGSLDWKYLCSSGESSGVKAFPFVKRLCFELNSSNDISVGPNTMFSQIDSLEELTLEVKNNLEPRLLNLQQCFSTSARTLTTITIVWTLQQRQVEVLIKLLCDSLQAISQENVIEVIEIRLEVTEGPPQLPLTILNFDQWKRLDFLLGNEGRRGFSKLEVVEVWIYLSMATTGPGARPGKVIFFKEYKALLEASLARLRTHSELEVDCTVYWDEASLV